MDEYVQSSWGSTMGVPEGASQAAIAEKTSRKDRTGRGGVRVLSERAQIHGRSSFDPEKNGKRTDR